MLGRAFNDAFGIDFVERLPPRVVTARTEEVIDTILRFCQTKGFSVERRSASGGEVLTTRGSVAGRLPWTPSPALVLEFEVNSVDADHTAVGLSRRGTPEYEASRTPRWAVASAGFLLVLLCVGNEVGLVFAFLMMMVAVVDLVERSLMKEQMVKMQTAFWSVLQRERGAVCVPTTGLPSQGIEGIDVAVMAVLVTGAAIVLLRRTPLSRTAVLGGIFAAGPVLLLLVAGWVSDKLPSRFKWSVWRLNVSHAMFALAFGPYLIIEMVRAIRSETMSGLAQSGGKFLLQLGLPFIVLFALVVATVSSIHTVLCKAQERYGPVGRSSTGHMEDLSRPKGRLFAFRMCSFMYLLLLSAGVVFLTVNSIGAPLEQRYVSSFGRLLAFEVAMHPFVENPGLVRPLNYLFTAALVLLLSPVLVLGVCWLLRLGRRTASLFGLSVVQDEGRFDLDAITRCGLFDEVKRELGADALIVRKARAPFSLFGAAITCRGLRRLAALLTIDPMAFSIVTTPREREALVWHEVAHARKWRPWRGLVLDIVLGIWVEHFLALLEDSMQTEFEADLFAATKMGDISPLISALRALQSCGAGASSVPTETKLRGVVVLLKIAVGAERVSYWHPHVEARVSRLAGQA